MGVLHPNGGCLGFLASTLDITESQELLVGLVVKSVAPEAHPNKHELLGGEET